VQGIISCTLFYMKNNLIYDLLFQYIKTTRNCLNGKALIFFVTHPLCKNKHISYRFILHISLSSTRHWAFYCNNIILKPYHEAYRVHGRFIKFSDRNFFFDVYFRSFRRLQSNYLVSWFEKKTDKHEEDLFSLFSQDYLLAMCVGGTGPVGQDLY